MNLENLTDEELLEYYSLYKLGMDKSKRFENRKINGTDLKFLYHVVRLLNEVEQILTTGDLDLLQNREQNKAIRRGEWKEQDIYDYFNQKERDLESVFLHSKLRDKPDESKLKNILIDCLEAYYGNLNEVVVRQDESLVALRDINNIIDKLKEKQIL